MTDDSQSHVSSADSSLKVSILNSTDRKVIIESLKIARVSIIGEREPAHQVKLILDNVQGAQEIWLVTRS